MQIGEVTVLNNLLPDHAAQQVQATLLSENFPWYWNEATLDDVPQATHQFTHIFWVQGQPNSNYSYLPMEIIRAVENRLGLRVNYISRAKANLLCTRGDVDVDQQHEIHTDLTEGEGVYSTVYYVGESDGDTVFFSDNNEETHRSPHTNNAAVVFNSMSLHRASLPRTHKRRVVMNLVFLAEV